MVGEGARASSGGAGGKFSKLGARSGPRTGSTHLIPSRSDVLWSSDDARSPSTYDLGILVFVRHVEFQSDDHKDYPLNCAYENSLLPSSGLIRTKYFRKP